MAVWMWAGMPTNPGMNRTGPCPSQELVDSYEMANGEAPITGYNADRTVATVNSASGYDPANPYVGRDPRFYASIYYNDAVRYLDQPIGKKVETFVGGTEEISALDRKHIRKNSNRSLRIKSCSILLTVRQCLKPGQKRSAMFSM